MKFFFFFPSFSPPNSILLVETINFVAFAPLGLRGVRLAVISKCGVVCVVANGLKISNEMQRRVEFLQYQSKTILKDVSDVL